MSDIPSMPILSAELFAIPIDRQSYIVYAPLRQAAIVANVGAVNFLAEIQAGHFDSAADPDGSLVEFLRRLEILDAGPESPPITAFSGTPEPTAVTLLLTTACNLLCTYCYASAGDVPARHMPLAVARRGIDFVAGNAAKRKLPSFEVAYHGGGEPTVNWRVMTESLIYARERAAALSLKLTAGLATNGVFDDARADWIIAHLSSVSVSFDGLPEAHDRNRRTASGEGSSHRVMCTLRRFDEVGFPYGLRVTVTADQIGSLPDSVEFICANFHPQRIQVEPAYQMGRWSGAPSAETEEFIAAYRQAQSRAQHHGQEIFFSAARLGTLTNHFCSASQDNFALLADGNVSACYEVFSGENRWAGKFVYGASEPGASGYKFNLPVLDNLRRQSVEHREFCRGCFAKWSCAGDCYHKALAVHGEEEFAGADRCHITRELTKDQILARIAESGGIFWHAPKGAAENRLPQVKEAPI
jgi:uncharacterized protein